MNRESRYLLPPECRYSASRRARARPLPRVVSRPRARLPDRHREKINENAPIGEPEFLDAPRFVPHTSPPAQRVPAIPGAINVSTLSGNEIVAIGVIGSPGAQTTAADIAALAVPAQTYVTLGEADFYTLADGSVQDQRVGIKDNLRLASADNPIMINGKIDGGSSIPVNIAGTALEFVWDIPSDTWMVF